MRDLPNIQRLPWLPILEDSADGIALAVAGPWRLAYVNPTLARWLGRSAAGFRGQPIDVLFSSTDQRVLEEQFERVGRGGESRVSFWHELAHPAGGALEAEIRLQRIVLEGELLVSVVVRGAPAARQHPTAMVAGRDPLTGLPDRSVLLARMEALLSGDRVADRQFAVLFIDLNNFKQINDTHGHLVGDRVLREVARRLAGCVRASDLIVRFGGDEFVALVESVAGYSEIEPVIQRIDAALAKPFALPDGEVVLSVSVGAAEALAEHRTPEDLLSDADRAMYASKRLPR